MTHPRPSLADVEEYFEIPGADAPDETALEYFSPLLLVKSDRAKATGKHLQVTIDDGPLDQPSLEMMLSVLRQRRITACFFVLGQEVEQNEAAARAIVSAGHAIGNHSWDHLEKGTSTYTDAEILNQFRRTQDAVRKATGVEMVYWRAPRGEDVARLEKILMTGPTPLYTLTHNIWLADSMDSAKVEKGGQRTAGGMLEAMKKDIAGRPKNKNIRLLLHVLPHTARALPEILDGLIAMGHVFVPFSQSE